MICTKIGNIGIMIIDYVTFNDFFVHTYKIAEKDNYVDRFDLQFRNLT